MVLTRIFCDMFSSLNWGSGEPAAVPYNGGINKRVINGLTKFTMEIRFHLSCSVMRDTPFLVKLEPKFDRQLPPKCDIKFPT